MACTSSPDSGVSTTTTVSAASATPSSVWPTPTVSRRMRPNALPSIRSITSCTASARPPPAPRVAIERMKTPRSSRRGAMRTRSPSNAPPEYGEVGSTATIATSSPASRQTRASAAARVDFPAPGGPVIPVRWARRPRAATSASRSRNPGRRSSTTEMARASAARSPAPHLSASERAISRAAVRPGAAPRPATAAIDAIPARARGATGCRAGARGRPARPGTAPGRLPARRPAPRRCRARCR